MMYAEKNNNTCFNVAGSQPTSQVRLELPAHGNPAHLPTGQSDSLGPQVKKNLEMRQKFTKEIA
jgi:hypothetical protein